MLLSNSVIRATNGIILPRERSDYWNKSDHSQHVTSKMCLSVPTLRARPGETGTTRGFSWPSTSGESCASSRLSPAKKRTHRGVMGDKKKKKSAGGKSGSRASQQNKRTQYCGYIRTATLSERWEPQHAKSQQDKLAYQLELGGVPEILVSLSLLEVLQRISPLSGVVRVGFKRVSRPPRRPGESVVVVCSAAKERS